jgi:hypothetical protein
VKYSNLVFQLQNSLYGLKQYPITWYAKIDHFFLNHGFVHCESDHSIYVLHAHGDTLIVVVYVDDLVITRNKIDIILRFKEQLADTFDMTYLGLLHYFLSLQVLPLCNGLFLSQYKYVMYILNHFNMDNCNLCTIPFQYGFKMTKECLSPKVEASLSITSRQS